MEVMLSEHPRAVYQARPISGRQEVGEDRSMIGAVEYCRKPKAILHGFEMSQKKHRDKFISLASEESKRSLSKIHEDWRVMLCDSSLSRTISYHLLTGQVAFHKMLRLTQLLIFWGVDVFTLEQRASFVC